MTNYNIFRMFMFQVKNEDDLITTKIRNIFNEPDIFKYIMRFSNDSDYGIIFKNIPDFMFTDYSGYNISELNKILHKKQYSKNLKDFMHLNNYTDPVLVLYDEPRLIGMTNFMADFINFENP